MLDPAPVQQPYKVFGFLGFDMFLVSATTRGEVMLLFLSEPGGRAWLQQDLRSLSPKTCVTRPACPPQPRNSRCCGPNTVPQPEPEELFPPVCRVPGECPQDVAQLIRDCTAAEPEARPTAAECVKRLLAVKPKRPAKGADRARPAGAGAIKARPEAGPR